MSKGIGLLNSIGVVVKAIQSRVNFKTKISQSKIGQVLGVVLVLAIILTPFASTPFVSASDTTFKSPTTSPSPEEWDNEDNAFSSNNVYATADGDDDDQGYGNFGFSVPTGSIINGIEVTVEAYSDTSGISTSVTTDGTFGTGSSNNSVSGWNESGSNSSNDGTISKAAGSGDDTASPDGGRFALIEGDGGYICRTFNTSGLSSPQLSYYWRGDGAAEDGENGVVEYRTSGNCNDGSGWTNINNHELDNGNVGSTAWSSLVTSSVPSNSGLLIRFRAGSSSNDESFRIDGVTLSGSVNNSGCQIQVRIGDGDDFSSYKDMTLTGSESTVTLGGSNDTWSGVTWTPNDFTNANFELEVRNNDPGATCHNDAVTRMDHIQAKVHFTEPTANPTLTQTCGLDIALVLDSSGSIDSGNLTTMKTAFNNFVDAFLPETPTMFSVTDFDTTATVTQSMTTSQAQVTSAVNSAASGGSTNWQDGLEKAQSTFTGGRGDKSDLIVFASDGEPNRYGNPAQGSSSGFDQTSFNAAVTEANSIKAGGTRIITLGIGVGGSGADYLKAISSSDAYYDASSFATLSAALAQLASDLCGGTITVTKLIDADGDLQTTDDQTPGEDWDFTIDSNIYATGQNGMTEAVEVDPGTYDVTESLHTNYNLISATCDITNSQSNIEEGTFDQLDGVNGIVIGALDIVSCTFINSPKAGTLTVIKKVVNDDGTKSNVAADFSLTVSGGTPGNITGSETGEAVVVAAGADYSVLENDALGYSVSYSKECTGTMPIKGNITCTVTNDDPEPTTGTLTIVKVVINDNGGGAVPGDFVPTLTDDEQNTTTHTFNTEIELAPGTYQVGETGGPSGYSSSFLLGNIDMVTNCTSTGQITIVEGQSVVCVIVNNDIPGTITVNKVVVGAGAPDDAGDFSLWVTPDDDDPISVENGDSNNFFPGAYTVTETAKPGYVMQYSGDCDSEGNITVALGQNKVCTMTNTWQTPQDPTVFNFIKYVCEDFSDVAGNEDANIADDTGGIYTQFSNYSENDPSFPPYVGPVNPSEKPAGCDGAADWQFKLSTDQNQTQNVQIVGYTNGNGVLQVPFSELNAELQDALSNEGQMWISEVEQSTHSFAALRCYNDALNGDNLEYLSFDGPLPTGNIYCIAYNVEKEVTVDPCTTEILSGVISGTTTQFKGVTTIDPVDSSDDTLFTGTAGNAVAADSTGFPGAWNPPLSDPDISGPGAIWVNGNVDQPSNPADAGGDGTINEWRLFSHTFTIPAGATGVSVPLLHFTSDNSVKVFLNDVLLDSHNNFATVKDTVGLTLTAGSTYTLEFVVKNDAYQGPDNPTGLLYALDAITFCEPHGITGRVWHDANNNQVFDEDESPLEGWVVYLDLNDNGSLDGEEPSTETDSNGYYSFYGLADGNYTVREVIQSGWEQTYPGSPDYKHIATVASVDSANDFGNRRTSGGGGGGGSSSGGGGGGGTPPATPPTPPGRVLGDSTTIPSIPMPTPTPSVLGASTTLPRTGTPTYVILMMLSVLAIVTLPKLIPSTESSEQDE